MWVSWGVIFEGLGIGVYIHMNIYMYDLYKSDNFNISVFVGWMMVWFGMWESCQWNSHFGRLLRILHQLQLSIVKN